MKRFSAERFSPPGARPPARSRAAAACWSRPLSRPAKVPTKGSFASSSANRRQRTEGREEEEEEEECNRHRGQRSERQRGQRLCRVCSHCLWGQDSASTHGVGPEVVPELNAALHRPAPRQLTAAAGVLHRGSAQRFCTEVLHRGCPDAVRPWPTCSIRNQAVGECERAEVSAGSMKSSRPLPPACSPAQPCSDHGPR